MSASVLFATSGDARSAVALRKQRQNRVREDRAALAAHVHECSGALDAFKEMTRAVGLGGPMSSVGDPAVLMDQLEEHGEGIFTPVAPECLPRRQPPAMGWTFAGHKRRQQRRGLAAHSVVARNGGTLNKGYARQAAARSAEEQELDARRDAHLAASASAIRGRIEAAAAADGADHVSPRGGLALGPAAAPGARSDSMSASAPRPRSASADASGSLMARSVLASRERPLAVSWDLRTGGKNDTAHVSSSLRFTRDERLLGDRVHGIDDAASQSIDAAAACAEASGVPPVYFARFTDPHNRRTAVEQAKAQEEGRRIGGVGPNGEFMPAGVSPARGARLAAHPPKNTFEWHGPAQHTVPAGFVPRVYALAPGSPGYDPAATSGSRRDRESVRRERAMEHHRAHSAPRTDLRCGDPTDSALLPERPFH